LFSNTFALNESELYKLFKESDISILQADKRIGFVCLTDKQILDQFGKLNIKQHFVQSDITEQEYLKKIKIFKHELSQDMPDQIKAMLPYHLLKNLNSNIQGEIGILRLLPKKHGYSPKSFDAALKRTKSKPIKSSSFEMLWREGNIGHKDKHTPPHFGPGQTL
jgi:hypothetical protein